jgi:hypothetical protein
MMKSRGHVARSGEVYTNVWKTESERETINRPGPGSEQAHVEGNGSNHLAQGCGLRGPQIYSSLI